MTAIEYNFFGFIWMDFEVIFGGPRLDVWLKVVSPFSI